jgi:hypothetical protein
MTRTTRSRVAIGTVLWLIAALVAPAVAAPGPAIVPRWTIPAEDETKPSAERGLSIREIEVLAFGEGAFGRTQRFTQPPWVVLVESAASGDRQLVPLLDWVYRQIRQEWPFLAQPRRPAVLVLFASRESEVRFWDRLAHRLDVVISGPASGFLGRAMAGIGSSWSGATPDETTRTMVWVHEAVHALMHQMLDVRGVPSWLAEGLARRYDLLATGHDVHVEVKAALAAGRIPALDALMGEKRIPSHGYLPAALLVDWLLDDPLRQSQLPVLFRELRTTGAADLAKLLTRHLGMSMDELERLWREWLRQRFG